MNHIRSYSNWQVYNMKTLVYSVERKELFFEDENVEELPTGFLIEYRLAIIANINLRSCLLFNSHDFSMLTYLAKLSILAPSLQHISQHAFSGLINLKSLYFEAPSIPRLPRYLIYDLMTLDEITLNVNDATSICMFFGLKLRTLNLTCSVAQINSLDFITLINVTYITINGSTPHIYQFTQINCKFLKYLRHLRLLSLSKVCCLNIELNSNLKNLKLFKCNVFDLNFVDNLKNLTHLEITNCTVSVSQDQLIKNIKLKNLILIKNNISMLSENDFNAFNDLVYLDLSNGQIQKIEKCFIGQASQSINVINIRSNYVTKIDSNAFINCDRLFRLDLSDNQLTVLNRNVFHSLNNINLLDLSNNKLVFLPKKVFSNLTYLKALDLSSNCLQKILSNWFSYDNRYLLQKLDLSFNLINFIDTNFFKILQNLINLNISKNRLGYCCNLFKDLKFLTILNLGFNRIRCLENKVFENLKYLETLKLSSNCISSIGEKTFDNMTKLQLLELKHNYLMKLPPDLFRSNLKLKYLYLNDNCLYSVPKKCFFHSINLQSLHLQNNRLRNLNWIFFPNNEYLHELHVDITLQPFLDNKLSQIQIFFYKR